MQLPIGPTIKQLRKNAGIKQEELAARLGVSVAAVSKWECGKTYPDITLLPGLANILHTNIDALLGYSQIMQEEELDLLVTSCTAIFDAGEFKKAYALLEEAMEKYPNDTALMFTCSSLLTIYARHLPEKEWNFYLNRAIELCKPAAETPNTKWQLAAQKSLTSLYIMNGQLDLAEETLKKYSDADDMQSNQTLAVILFKKEEFEKAEEIYQRSLFQAINNCEMALNGLTGIAYQKNNDEYYLALHQKTLELTRLFGLENFPGKGLNTYLSLCYYYAKKEDTAQFLTALQGLAKSFTNWKKPMEFSKFPLFSQMATPEGTVFTSIMNDTTTRVLAEFKTYDFINQNPDFKALLQEIENTLL